MGRWLFTRKKMITKDRLQQALTYLAETDEECARLRSAHARNEFAAKSIKNVILKNLTEGTGPVKMATAETSDEYMKAKMEEFDYFFKYEAMKNKRITETILIDTWRSLNAGRNKGQII